LITIKKLEIMFWFVKFLVVVVPLWYVGVNQDKLNNNFFNNKKVRYGGYKIKKIHIDFINKCLLENKTITIKQLKEYLMLKFSLNISHSHLSRVVKKNRF